eukprot:gene10786-3403_t
MLKNQERFLKKYFNNENAESKDVNQKRKIEEVSTHKKTNAKKIKKEKSVEDPSSLYIKDPYSAPIVKEAKKFFLNNFKMKLPVHMGDKEGWRNISKLPVRRETKDINSKPIIGLFSPGSRKLISKTEFPAHHPSINTLTPILIEGFMKNNLSGYSDEDGTGDIRYVMMSVNLSNSKVQLTIVFNQKEATKNLKKFVKWLRKKNEDILHSVWVHFRNATSTSDSAIFGRDENSWSLLFSSNEKDEGYICEKMNLNDLQLEKTPELCFSPSVFRQANLTQFQKIINSIRKRIPENSNVIELYAGVCTIGMNIVDKVSYISCSDENPNNVECFKKSVESLNPKYQNIISYTPSSASEMVKKSILSNSDVIIVDPARKGLDKDVIESFLRVKNPKLLFYVSCGFSAFKRDCLALTKNGKNAFKLVHAEGHILFPGSDHIETLAVFERE